MKLCRYSWRPRTSSHEERDVLPSQPSAFTCTKPVQINTTEIITMMDLSQDDPDKVISDYRPSQQVPDDFRQTLTFGKERAALMIFLRCPGSVMPISLRSCSSITSLPYTNTTVRHAVKDSFLFWCFLMFTKCDFFFMIIH